MSYQNAIDLSDPRKVHERITKQAPGKGLRDRDDIEDFAAELLQPQFDKAEKALLASQDKELAQLKGKAREALEDKHTSARATLQDAFLLRCIKLADDMQLIYMRQEQASLAARPDTYTRAYEDLKARRASDIRTLCEEVDGLVDEAKEGLWDDAFSQAFPEAAPDPVSFFRSSIDAQLSALQTRHQLQAHRQALALKERHEKNAMDIAEMFSAPASTPDSFAAKQKIFTAIGPYRTKAYWDKVHADDRALETLKAKFEAGRDVAASHLAERYRACGIPADDQRIIERELHPLNANDTAKLSLKDKARLVMKVQHRSDITDAKSEDEKEQKRFLQDQLREAKIAGAGLSWHKPEDERQEFHLLKAKDGTSFAAIREAGRDGQDPHYELSLYANGALCHSARCASLQEAKTKAEHDIIDYLAADPDLDFKKQRWQKAAPQQDQDQQRASRKPGNDLGF